MVPTCKKKRKKKPGFVKEIEKKHMGNTVIVGNHIRIEAVS